MFSDLNEKQKEAVFWGNGPLLIVAGAGSGKTKTLTSRLAFLISERKVDPQRIVAITFTNKAAGEMKERVEKMTKNPKISRQPFLGTFHSLGARILRKEAGLFGRTADFSIFDGDDSLRLVKKIVKNANLSSKKLSPAAFLKEFSRIKSELIEIGDFLNGGEKERLVWEFFEDYETALERNNAFDFDDLIEKVVRLFREDKKVWERYQGQYDYVLVDEYQDINTAQYWMLRLLVGSHNNINVVGDDSQSIYSFRFSDFRNFLNFERDWPQAKTVFLEQNYRSTQNIIESSSAVIAKNTLGKLKKLWTNNSRGTLIKVIEHSDEFEEADFIVNRAREFINQKKSVGILFRTNAQSRALEQLFLEYGVSYNLFGALSFYERKEIKDIVAALRFAFNPKDEMSWERLEKSFSKKTVVVLKNGLLEKRKNSSPADLIGYFLKTTDYFEEIKKEYANFQERQENIRELIYFASQFESLGNFLEKIALASPLDLTLGRRKKKKPNLQAASLMTIHLAKGLEFDVVLAVGVNEGILPHQRSLFSGDDLEEERRLMYVAMTRAREELFLNFFGTPSRFLYEIPPEKVEFRVEKPLDEEERWIEYN